MRCELGLFRGDQNARARGLKASAGPPRARGSVRVCLSWLEEEDSSDAQTGLRPKLPISSVRHLTASGLKSFW